MRFRLHYEGDLKANDVPGKSAIRKHFSGQLKQLWDQLPLSDISHFTVADRGEGTLCIRKPVGSASYIPIATTGLATIAELDILLIRPGQPGDLLQNGADLDNRLKTLLDALQPPHCNAADRLDEQGDIYCVVEDDKLITRLNIETDRLLKPVISENHAIIVVKVEIRPIRALTSNVALLC